MPSCQGNVPGSASRMLHHVVGRSRTLNKGLTFGSIPLTAQYDSLHTRRHDDEAHAPSTVKHSCSSQVASGQLLAHKHTNIGLLIDLPTTCRHTISNHTSPKPPFPQRSLLGRKCGYTPFVQYTHTSSMSTASVLQHHYYESSWPNPRSDIDEPLDLAVAMRYISCAPICGTFA